MRLILVVAVAAMVAGCAMSPVDLREDGRRAELKSSKPPRDAALCLTRNAEGYKPWGPIGAGYTAYWRETAKPGAYEVLVPSPAGGTGYLLIADVAPQGGGSQITTWLKASFIPRIDRAMLAGCE